MQRAKPSGRLASGDGLVEAVRKSETPITVAGHAARPVAPHRRAVQVERVLEAQVDVPGADKEVAGCPHAAVRCELPASLLGAAAGTSKERVVEVHDGDQTAEQPRTDQTPTRAQM